MVRTQSQLLAEVAANITDPQNRQNTAAKVREVCNDIIDTMFDTNMIYSASLSITTAQVLQLNSTPLEIVAAPGAGKYIEVVSASALIETYGGTPYATNTDLQLINPTAGEYQALIQDILKSTTPRIRFFSQSGATGSTTLTSIIPNTALQVNVASGNPTAGNSDIKIKVLYRIVTI
jgi:hypothetical protein